MPVVRIRRDTTPYSDRKRRYRVFLDDQEAGSLAWGQTIEIPTIPGAHKLRIKIDWTGSPTVPFQVSDSEDVDFVTRPRRPAGFALYSLIRSIRHRDEWLLLERV